MIERKILIGLITSTEYFTQIRPIISSKFFKSDVAKRLVLWCIEYFDKYEKAPGRHIEDIYYAKLKAGLPKDIATEIEEDILPDLSSEYEEEGLNIGYLIDNTKAYFNERSLKLHISKINEYIEQGNILEAEKAANEYKGVSTESLTAINLSKPESIRLINRAFEEAADPLIHYPHRMGDFLDTALVRGGFVAFMAAEKRGKSYFLLDMAMRAVRQKVNVAFFQAGDMTENQQLRRICINLAGKSDKEKYTGKMYEPVKDCIYNQLDICTKGERECDFGIFNMSEKDLKYGITLDELKEAYEDNPDYTPCHNCRDYMVKNIGTVWIKEIVVNGVLGTEEAEKLFENYFVKYKRKFMLSTHPNDTLTVEQINSVLDIWEKQEFVADLIIIDYADLLTTKQNMETRHQQNHIWKGLRALSQKRHCLVVTATQADADSYTKNRITTKNFSEDKRKFGHVTGMFGLNQDPEGREKAIGIMRLNELVVREDDFNVANELFILQNLRRGRPVIGSYR